MPQGLVKGFRPIAVPLGYANASHYFFIKEHRDKSGNQPGRTLFVANVEYGLDPTIEQVDKLLRDLFGVFGDIESVSVSKFTERAKHTRDSRFAHVVYVRQDGLRKALSASEAEYTRNASKVMENWGLGEACRAKTAIELYEMFVSKRQDPASLKAEADIFMEQFEAREELEQQAKAKASSEPDKDGFVTVTYKAKRKRSRIDDMSEVATKKTRARNKKKNTELKHFYRFQIREEKRERLADLRHKFELDKARIQKMKQQRKFKPF